MIFTIDFTEPAKLIGELVAAATHDLKTADPSEVGMNGVPICAWRSAYAEGCRDMANMIVSKLPADQYEIIKEAVKASMIAELARLDASAVSRPERLP